MKSIRRMSSSKSTKFFFFAWTLIGNGWLGAGPRWTGRSEWKKAALESLRWLANAQTAPEGHFRPIGSNGFYERGASPAAFDQQPVEACATVSACLDAYHVLDDRRWLTQARWAFNWFLGENHLQHWLFDASTGGCRDGLHIDRPNQNQGAEATLSFLFALHELRTVAALEALGGRVRELQPTS